VKLDLLVDLVSSGHPSKPHVEVREKAAALGVKELVVFDPTLAGPRPRGGPWRLQAWQSAEWGLFELGHAGDGLLPPPRWRRTG